MKPQLLGLTLLFIMACHTTVYSAAFTEYWKNRSGISHTQNHRYDKATAAFESGLKTATADARIDMTFNLGSAELAAGKTELATQHLQSTLMSRDPLRRSDSFYQLALAHAKSNNQSLAIGSLKSALMANPNHAAARQTLLELLTMPPKSPKNEPKPDKKPQPKPDSAPKQQLLNKIAEKEAAARRAHQDKNRANSPESRVIEW